MFVKKLELLGFKTFADKTEIEFGQGITVIVGPNGCGKSNIADAVLWVLGESNVRNLRGQRMTDVIFNGSEKRRSHGMAEVSLTLDNSERKLPLDFAEVTVTRRAYRSGESEYLINNTRCRLKDIYELFLDTGVGREAYSIVTQGEIDAVLSARPEDRRELFEEAAGIRKYRYRREEALRKLERTEANLRRVCDIMAEIGSQVEPLAAQAEQARRYAELQSRLWDIEIGLLIRDLKRYVASLEEVRAAKSDAAEQVALHERRIAELEARKQTQSGSLSVLEEQVDSARKVHQMLVVNVQRLESKAELLDERTRSIETSRERAFEENAAAQSKIAETRGRIASLEADFEQARQEESDAAASAKSLEAALAELEKRADELSASLDSRKASHLELQTELSVKRNALHNLEQRAEELQAAIDRFEQEIAQLREQASSAQSAGRAAADALARTMSEIAEVRSRIESSETSLREVERQAAARTDELAQVEKEIASKSSRLKALREMAEAGEGLAEGVRSVIAAARSGKLRGEFVVLADVIKVAEGYELAVESALGSSAQDVIVSSTFKAAEAIAYLSANLAGRATFRPLCSPNPASPSIKPPREDGCLGLASDLVTCDSKYAGVVRSLLSGSLVVDSLDRALDLASRLAGWDTIVTLSGELVLPGGAVSGGKSKSGSQGLFQRKAEMDSLASEVAALEKQAADTSKAVEELRARSEAGRREIESLSESLFACERDSVELEKSIELNRQASAGSLSRVEVLTGNLEETTSLNAQVDEEAARLRAELDSADAQTGEIQVNLAAAQEAARQILRDKDAKRDELTRLNVKIGGLKERVSALAASIEVARQSLAELEGLLDERTGRIEAWTAEHAALDEERARVGAEMASQRQLLDTAARRLEEAIRSRAEAASACAAIESQLKDAYARRSEYAEVLHDADVREARFEVQITQIRERLLTEYELTYEKAMEWPDEEIEVERGTATEVARLRREIRDMGPVNTGAIQEYERVKERWDFLTAQRADLENAKAQIGEAIRDIDAKTRGLFLETFESAAASFDEMFKRLFGGGRAELTLADPKDPLETGIDIAVQPPGKKLQDLALLSGGERALTAATLIFALLKVKPSPFVLMDEVDAALDESNVERFAQLLTEFARQLQFVVVTHNRATMEASSALYGVTMQEPGVSKLISVRLAPEGPVERELEPAAAK